MDDLINKMKQTEEEARQIVSNAEQKASTILNDATIEAAKKSEEQRKQIYEKLSADKDAKYNLMIEERDKKIAANIDQYKASFGDIESKKQKCVAAIEKSISESLK